MILKNLSFFYRPIWLWSYILIILLLVALPLNSTKQLNDITVITFRGDYFFHTLVFLPWMFFQPVSKINMAAWLITGVLFACGSEGLQYLLPYRVWNINDLLANAFGVLIGFSISTLLNFFLKK